MYINVNNIKLHYEVYGKGNPIILLHGNGENIKIFKKLINKLKKTHKVYAIDSRCHGKSEKTKKITYDEMTLDIIDFIKKLNIKKPIFYGFSDGGIVGLMVAAKESQILSKLIISGANLNPKGFKPFAYIFTKIVYFVTRSKLYKLMTTSPNLTKAQLSKIKIPVAVLAGEKDIIKQSHTEKIANYIPNSTLEIIPGENHGSYIVNSDKIYKILKKYIF